MAGDCHSPEEHLRGICCPSGPHPKQQAEEHAHSYAHPKLQLNGEQPHSHRHSVISHSQFGAACAAAQSYDLPGCNKGEAALPKGTAMVPRGAQDRDRRPWTQCMLGLVLLLALLALCPMAFYWGVHLERVRGGEEPLPTLCPCAKRGLGQVGPVLPRDEDGQAGRLPWRAQGNFTEVANVSASANGSLIRTARKRTRELPVEEVLARVGGPERMLIWGTASVDYLDFLQNWFLSVQRVGYGHKVLLVAEDEVSLDFLLGRWPNQTVSGMKLCAEAEASCTRAITHVADSTFGTSYYMALVDRRPEYFKALLGRNYTVLYNDVDIVWLGDPFPFFGGSFDLWVQKDSTKFKGPSQWPSTAHEPEGHGSAIPLPLGLRFKAEHGHGLCTCFILARPTLPAKRLMRLWSEALREKVRSSGASVLNQPVFNAVVNSLLPDEVGVAVLPVGSFPSGCLYFRRRRRPFCKLPYTQYWEAVDANLTAPVVVHNNWVRGHRAKVQTFKSMNLWLLPLNTRIKPWRSDLNLHARRGQEGMTPFRFKSQALQRLKTRSSLSSASKFFPSHPVRTSPQKQPQARPWLRRQSAHRERLKQLWAERWRKNVRARSKSS